MQRQCHLLCRCGGGIMLINGILSEQWDVNLLGDDFSGLNEVYREIANEIGPTVPPVGIAIFAPKETLNLARHWLVKPRRLTNPLPFLWTILGQPLITTSVNNTF